MFGEKEESKVSFSPFANYGKSEKCCQIDELQQLFRSNSTPVYNMRHYRESSRGTHLVLQGDLGAQGVVGVPLLCEGEAVLGPLVLGLQGAGHLAGLRVG